MTGIDRRRFLMAVAGTAAAGLADGTGAWATPTLSQARARAATYRALVRSLCAGPDGRFRHVDAAAAHRRYRRWYGASPASVRTRMLCSTSSSRRGVQATRSSPGGRRARVAEGEARSLPRHWPWRASAANRRRPRTSARRSALTLAPMSTILRRIIDLGAGATRDRVTRATTASTTTACSSPRRTPPGCGCGPTGRRCSPTRHARPTTPTVPARRAAGPRRADPRANADGVKVLLAAVPLPAVGQRPRGARRAAQHRRRDLLRLSPTASRRGLGGATSRPAATRRASTRAAARSSSGCRRRASAPAARGRASSSSATTAGTGASRRQRPTSHGFELVNEPNFQCGRSARRPPATIRSRSASLTAQAHGRADDADGGEGRRAIRRRHAALRAVVRRQRARRAHGDAIRRVRAASARRARRRSAIARPDRGLVAPQLHRPRAPLHRHEAQRMRALLPAAGRATAKARLPTVFVTEGGVRLSKMASYYPARIASRPRRSAGSRAGIAITATTGPAPASACSPSTRPTPTPASTPGCSTHGRQSCAGPLYACGRRCRRMRELASDEPSVPAVITTDPQAGEPMR